MGYLLPSVCVSTSVYLLHLCICVCSCCAWRVWSSVSRASSSLTKWWWSLTMTLSRFCIESSEPHSATAPSSTSRYIIPHCHWSFGKLPLSNTHTPVWYTHQGHHAAVRISWSSDPPTGRGIWGGTCPQHPLDIGRIQSSCPPATTGASFRSDVGCHCHYCGHLLSVSYASHMQSSTSQYVSGLHHHHCLSKLRPHIHQSLGKLLPLPVTNLQSITPPAA